MGTSGAGLAMALFHAGTFVRRLRQPGSLLDEQDIDWRAMTSIGVWLLTAFITSIIALAEAMMTYSSGDFGTSLLGLMVIGLLALMSAEVFYALYLPGATILSKLSVFILNLGLGAEDKDEDGTRQRPLDHVLRMWRSVVDIVDLDIRKIADPVREPATNAGPKARQLSRASWLAYFWGLIVTLCVLGLSLAIAPSMAVQIAMHIMGGVLVVCCAVQGYALYLGNQHLQSRPDREPGFVPKDIAPLVLDKVSLPSEMREDDYLEDKPDVQARSNARLLALLGLGLVMCALGFSIACAALVGLAGGFQITTFSGLLITAIGVFGIFHFHRRVVDLWQDAGFHSATIFSQGFARDAGHRLRNLVGPVDTALNRSAELLETLNRKSLKDKELYDYTKQRLTIGLAGLDSIFDWLNRLSRNSRKISANRRRWLEALEEIEISTEQFVVHFAETVETQCLTFQGKFKDTPLRVRFRVYSNASDKKSLEHSIVIKTGELAGSLVPSPSDILDSVPEEFRNATIVMDVKMLYDAVSNITRNAVEALLELQELPPRRASSDGIKRPTITVAVRLHWGVETPVTFSIRDNGPGIPFQDRDALFDPYVRSSAKEHSTGVGLYSAREFLHSTGGKLWASSSTGSASNPSYTTFLMLLPDSIFK